MNVNTRCGPAVLSQELVNASSSTLARTPKSLLLFQAYQEYFDRLERGEHVDPDEHCARHPQLRSSLGKLLQLHLFLEANDQLTEAPPYPAAGTRFLHFDLLSELGEGAFAKVYLAEDTKLGGRRVALKLSRRANAEAKIMGTIAHRNIVLVHSIDEDASTGLSAICMPFVGNATLEDLLDHVRSQAAMPSRARSILDGLPSAAETSRDADAADPILRHGTYVAGIRLIGAQIADALDYLHSRDICHRDMKPSNVLLTPEGTPMLLDFNLSTEFQADDMPFGGTLPYMAPEILTAIGTVERPAASTAEGAKADLYSLGIILYQLLTGLHPLGELPLKLKTRELRDLLLERQRARLTPACEVNPQVDRALSELIQRCLAFAPAQRPRSAGEVAEALKPGRAPAEATTKLGQGRRRLLAAVALCGILASLLFLANSYRPLTLEQQLAASQASYERGNYHDAIAQCDRALLLDPESATAYFLRARARLKCGELQGYADFNAACADYRAANFKSPQGRFQAGVGYCMNGMGENIKAVAAYRAALAFGYENAEVHNNLGYSLTKLGHEGEAVAHLNKAIERKPHLAIAYYNRAAIALNQALQAHNTRDAGQQKKVGDVGRQIVLPPADGMRDFARAIELKEDSASVYFDAALLCAIAAESDPRCGTQAIAYLKLSLQRGCNPALLKNRAFKSIENDITSDKLMERANPSPISSARQRFLDPVED
jgi:serine/threonine protein kinase